MPANSDNTALARGALAQTRIGHVLDDLPSYSRELNRSEITNADRERR